MTRKTKTFFAAICTLAMGLALPALRAPRLQASDTASRAFIRIRKTGSASAVQTGRSFPEASPPGAFAPTQPLPEALDKHPQRASLWVFGYGSLMWDHWEKQFGGIRYKGALLKNYHRAFNKESTRNWGSEKNPGPTLGLEAGQGSECVGCAFAFPESRRNEVLRYLAKREGASFSFPVLTVRLADGRAVSALTAVNDRVDSTYIGQLPANRRAAMACAATGTCGPCAAYVKSVYEMLKTMHIEDPYVTHFYRSTTLY